MERPGRRRIIQLYAALLYNSNIGGFAKGQIFTGSSKNLCVPGLNCYSCPGAVAACPIGSLQNSLAASQTRLPFYIFGILILFGLSLGRTVCGWLCPFGLVQELLYKIKTPKLKKNRVTRILSYNKYIILAVFVLLLPIVLSMGGVPVPAFCKYICPAGTLGGAIPLILHPSNGAVRDMLGGLFINKAVISAVVIAAAIFIFRFFCRFFCPLGALYGFFSRIAIIGIKVDENKCTGCGACTAYCRMDTKKVGDHECINCGECMKYCHSGAIEQKGPKPGRKGRLILQIAAVALLIGMLVYAGVSSCRASHADSTAVQAGNAEQNGALPAGDARDGGSGQTGDAQESGLTAGSEVGKLCPEFTFALTDGSTYDISGRSGKMLVINFWATWCGPCVKELPDFEKLQKQYADKLDVIAVHSQFITDDVDEYIAKAGLGLRFAIDTEGTAEETFGVSQMFPQTVIVDGSGVIIYNAPGALSFEELEALIR